MTLKNEPINRLVLFYSALLSLSATFLSPLAAFAEPLGRLEVMTLPVGYGECHLVAFREESAIRWAGLMDAGPASGAGIVIETLKEQGITRVDTVFISHAHENHFAGVEAIHAEVPVQHLRWSGATYDAALLRSMLQRLAKQGVLVEEVKAGQTLQHSPNLLMHVIHPEDRATDVHDHSLVLALQHGRNFYLFPGDLSPTAQTPVWTRLGKMLARHQGALQWIAWPHHGDHLAPSWVRAFADIPHIVVSVGENEFGLPRENLYPDLLSRALRTDRLGSIRFTGTGNAVSHHP